MLQLDLSALHINYFVFSNTHYNVDQRCHVDMETNVNVNSHKGLECLLANARSLESKFQDFHAIGFAEHNLMYLLIQRPRLIPVFWTTKWSHLILRFTEETAMNEEELGSYLLLKTM